MPWGDPKRLQDGTARACSLPGSRPRPFRATKVSYQVLCVLHPTKHLPPHRAILGLRRGGDAVAEPVSVVVVGRARAWIAGIALYVFHGATGENT